MLFDLQSPRRRFFIKTVYSILAILLAGGLVFFGIGSDATGGISDIFTGGGGAADNPFEDEIEDAENRAKENPRDAAAQAELVQLYYQTGNSRLEVDEETQQQVFTSEAQESYTKAANAWDRYVKLTGGKQVDSSAALLAVQAYSALANGALNSATGGGGQEALDSADDALTFFKSAAGAQETIANQGGRSEDHASVAQFLFFSGDFGGGEQAAQRALATAKGGARAELQKQLDQAEKQARQLNDQIESFRKQLAQAGGGAPEENPLSDLGGGGGGLGGEPGGALATP